MRRTDLKEHLARNTVTIGGWVTLAHPAIAEIMANAGFDWVVVDLEHSAIGIAEAAELIRVIELAGAAPLVRVTSNERHLIKRVMDAGAHGVIVPMVNSEEDARRAVDAVYYPPRGGRGVGLSRAHDYGAGFGPYCDWLNRDAVVIVQIEHIDAVTKLESILAIEGIDAYIIGPYDLSASMGISGQLHHPDLLAALARVRDVGRKMKKSGGVHLVEPDPEALSGYLADGFSFIAYSVDIRILDCACRAVAALTHRNKQ